MSKLHHSGKDHRCLYITVETLSSRLQSADIFWNISNYMNMIYTQISLLGRPAEQPRWNHPYLFCDTREKATMFTPSAALIIEYYVANAGQWQTSKLPVGWFQRGYLLSSDILCNAEFSPCWALPEYIRALNSLGLFAGLFTDAMGYCLPIVSCEMTRTKWLVLKAHIGST